MRRRSSSVAAPLHPSRVTPAAVPGRILCGVTTYEIRVRGRVTDSLLPLFDGWSA